MPRSTNLLVKLSGPQQMSHVDFSKQFLCGLKIILEHDNWTLGRGGCWASGHKKRGCHGGPGHSCCPPPPTLCHSDPGRDMETFPVEALSPTSPVRTHAHVQRAHVCTDKPRGRRRSLFFYSISSDSIFTLWLKTPVWWVVLVWVVSPEVTGVGVTRWHNYTKLQKLASPNGREVTCTGVQDWLVGGPPPPHILQCCHPQGPRWKRVL